MHFNGHNIPLEAICNDLSFSPGKTRPPSLCVGLFGRIIGAKCPLVELFHTSKTATSGGERLGIVSARFRRQVCVTVSCRPRYSQCVYNWGIV